MFKIYTYIFGRLFFKKLNSLLFKLGSHGLGILNYQNPKLSGEYFLLKHVLQKFNTNNGIIFDVGANNGMFSKTIREVGFQNKLIAFEPNPKSFEVLKSIGAKYKFDSYNFGFSESIGSAKIYDSIKDTGSEHASLYKEVQSEIHKNDVASFDINLSTIDFFCQQQNISSIFFLKIDTEGHELSVLKGAQSMLDNSNIKFIQFEFNEMNVISRCFIFDFIKLLNNYTLYRLLPKGLLKIESYNSFKYEIFAFQNILAVHNSIIF